MPAAKVIYFRELNYFDKKKPFSAGKQLLFVAQKMYLL